MKNRRPAQGRWRAEYMYTFQVVTLMLFVILYARQPIKRVRSDGSASQEASSEEAKARLERAFTMPQFVTSVSGYGGSARAKQVTFARNPLKLTPRRSSRITMTCVLLGVGTLTFSRQWFGSFPVTNFTLHEKHLQAE